MKRLKCVIAYDGTHFEGYQRQPEKRTIQGEIEKVLMKMHKGEMIPIFASGRTDAHVHAKGQVIHFDSPLEIPEDRWKIALNTLLPPDIVVVTTEEVPSDFHARFSVKGKEYHYYISLKKDRDPFTRNYYYHFPYPLHFQKMEKAAKYLVGTYDFTSFCSAKTEVKDRIRTIESLTLIQEGDQLIIKIKGTGFLYNMVRIIVGTLLEVGTGKRAPEEIPQIIEAKDRMQAGKTVPGHGLYLYKVYY